MCACIQQTPVMTVGRGRFLVAVVFDVPDVVLACPISSVFIYSPFLWLSHSWWPTHRCRVDCPCFLFLPRAVLSCRFRMAFFFSLRALSKQSESSKQCPTLQPYVKFAANVGAQLCKSNSCLNHFVTHSRRGAFDATDLGQWKRFDDLCSEIGRSSIRTKLIERTTRSGKDTR